jgi:argininosuccinate lyase
MGAALVGLGMTLVQVARSHVGTLMSDFTYLHHAHPTSLGHYLLAHAYPVVRDLERADRALRLVNRSPAGAGSVNGSRFAIDRDLLAQLLGFDSVIEHTRDAMWAPDMALEILFAAGSAMTVVDRIAEELQLWTTEEFGYVQLDDRHCRTSVVMPQKRNPYSLAWLRGQARFTFQMYSAVGATMHTISGQPDNRTFAYVAVPRAVEQTAAAVELLAEVIGHATFDKDRLATAATTGHTYATDVCDHLTLSRNVDNRTAHRLVGRAVRAAVDDAHDTISAADLAAAADELGIALVVPDDDELAALIAPAAIVASRRTRGGAAAEPMADMVAELSSVLELQLTRWRDHPLKRFPESFAARIDAVLA